MYGMKCIEAVLPKHIPNVRHFQIIVFNKTSVYIPGDERSKQCPGHGYPEHTEEYNTPKIYVTMDEAAWRHDLALLLEQKPGRNDIVAFVVDTVASVKMVPSIDL